MSREDWAAYCIESRRDEILEYHSKTTAMLVLIELHKWFHASLINETELGVFNHHYLPYINRDGYTMFSYSFLHLVLSDSGPLYTTPENKLALVKALSEIKRIVIEIYNEEV